MNLETIMLTILKRMYLREEIRGTTYVEMMDTMRPTDRKFYGDLLIGYCNYSDMRTEEGYARFDKKEK